MNTTIEITVHGEARPRGSKIAQPIYRKNADGTRSPVMKHGRVITVARDDNPKSDDWMARVAAEAAKRYQDDPIRGAVELSICFWFTRPKSHFRTGKATKHLLASAAPQHHAKKPDLDKLIRGTKDALSGIVYADDSQVVSYGHMAKHWTTEQSRTEIRVRVIDMEDGVLEKYREQHRSASDYCTTPKGPRDSAGAGESLGPLFRTAETEAQEQEP